MDLHIKWRRFDLGTNMEQKTFKANISIFSFCGAKGGYGHSIPHSHVFMEQKDY